MKKPVTGNLISKTISEAEILICWVYKDCKGSNYKDRELKGDVALEFL